MIVEDSRKPNVIEKISSFIVSILAIAVILLFIWSLF